MMHYGKMAGWMVVIDRHGCCKAKLGTWAVMNTAIARACMSLAV